MWSAWRESPDRTGLIEHIDEIELSRIFSISLEARRSFTFWVMAVESTPFAEAFPDLTEYDAVALSAASGETHPDKTGCLPAAGCG
jgi:hypothetical protein